jgi:hypothetical protein
MMCDFLIDIPEKRRLLFSACCYLLDGHELPECELIDAIRHIVETDLYDARSPNYITNVYVSLKKYLRFMYGMRFSEYFYKELRMSKSLRSVKKAMRTKRIAISASSS